MKSLSPNPARIQARQVKAEKQKPQPNATFLIADEKSNITEIRGYKGDGGTVCSIAAMENMGIA